MVADAPSSVTNSPLAARESPRPRPRLPSPSLHHYRSPRSFRNPDRPSGYYLDELFYAGQAWGEPARQSELATARRRMRERDADRQRRIRQARREVAVVEDSDSEHDSDFVIIDEVVREARASRPSAVRGNNQEEPAGSFSQASSSLRDGWRRDFLQAIQGEPSPAQSTSVSISYPAVGSVVPTTEQSSQPRANSSSGTVSSGIVRLSRQPSVRARPHNSDPPSQENIAGRYSDLASISQQLRLERRARELQRAEEEDSPRRRRFPGGDSVRAMESDTAMGESTAEPSSGLGAGWANAAFDESYAVFFGSDS